MEREVIRTNGGYAAQVQSNGAGVWLVIIFNPDGVWLTHAIYNKTNKAGAMAHANNMLRDEANNGDQQ